jgi:hypothetical protein
MHSGVPDFQTNSLCILGWSYCANDFVKVYDISLQMVEHKPIDVRWIADISLQGLNIPSSPTGVNTPGNLILRLSCRNPWVSCWGWNHDSLEDFWGWDDFVHALSVYLVWMFELMEAVRWSRGSRQPCAMEWWKCSAICKAMLVMLVKQY